MGDSESAKSENAPHASKRPAEDEPEGEKPKEDQKEESDDDDDVWIGPMPTEAAAAKKRKVLKHEKLYLAHLPSAEAYERSFMHRDAVIFARVTPNTDFVVTASQDGHVKFWKKQAVGVEFVKHFRAHLGNVADVKVNHNGTLMCTISNDKHAKIFDVVNFDMINVIKLPFEPSSCEWIHGSGDALAALAIAQEGDSNAIHVYDGRGDPSKGPLKTLTSLHMKPVSCLAYNHHLDTAISADRGGLIEFWAAKDEYGHPKGLEFESKLDTDLFELAKCKTYALNMSVSPDGRFLACLAADKHIRLFRFLTGKLYCVLDESLKHYIEMQQVKQLFPAMEFNRKVSTEKEIERAELLKYSNIVFDATSNFIMYGSLAGVKVANIFTNKGVRVLGKPENMRFLNLGLFQGLVKTSTAANTIEMATSENPSLSNDGARDPTLFATAYKKNRFFLFTRRSPRDTSSVDSSRDIFNEKPSKEDIIAASTEEKGSSPRLFDTATIHTTLGDIHVQLFARECPKTVENFCVHAKNGYFNGHIWHRCIKQFMIQTGDPTGVGTGGESIWGGEFEDEFHPTLRHDRPYTLSMANAGPNTNGSQFFITVVPTPWLDKKHTVFGRVTRGMEVVLSISNAKTHPKTDKPYDDMSVVSVTVKNAVRL